MNALIPPTVALIEADAEAVVIGSMIVRPEAVAMLMPELRPEYFADPGARLFFEGIDRLHRAGHRISGTALLAGISPSAEGGGVTRSAVLAAMAKQAVPLSYLSAYVATLRDRWARRALVRQAEVLQHSASILSLERKPADDCQGHQSTRRVIKPGGRNRFDRCTRRSHHCGCSGRSRIWCDRAEE